MTYTSNDGFSKPVDGADTDVWGPELNTTLDLIDEALDGVSSIDMTGLLVKTLVVTDGVTSNGRPRVIVFTGVPLDFFVVSITPTDLKKTYFIVNQTAFAAVFAQGSGATVTVPANSKGIIYCDGAGATAAVYSLLDQVDISNLRGAVAIAGAVTLASTLGVTGVSTFSGKVGGQSSLYGLQIVVAASAPLDVNIPVGTMVAYLDETAHAIKFRVRESGGTYFTKTL